MKTIGFIGGGNMAEALLAGITKTDLFNKECVWVSDVRSERLDELKAQYGVRVTSDNVELTQQADVLMLSVKPQVMPDVLEDIAGTLKEDVLVISIAAGAGYWMACLDQSAAATEAALHGFSRAAIAVAADGRAVDGRAAMVGPVGWFVSTDGEVHGILAAREGSTRAGVVNVPDSEAMGELVKQLAAGKRVLLPLDVTEGRAALLQADQRGLYDELVTGGVVMIPLVLVALLAMVVAVLKTVSLWRVHGVDAHAAVAIAQSYAAGDTAAAERSSAALPAPLRAVVNEGLAHYDAAPVILEEIVEERVMSQLPGLERHLWLLAVLAGIAPLLGLLGTVTGMIHTFQLVTVFGTGDAGLLSGGISEALVTTKFGLVIAIPVLVVHALLSRRVRTLMAELEQAATAFVHALISARTAGSSDGGAVS